MQRRNLLCVFFVLAGLAPGGSEEERLVRIQQSISSGDLRGARSELQQLQTRVPGDPRIYNFLGVIDAQEKNFSAAESSFLRAIQIAPRFAGALLNLGRLYQEHDGSSAKALEVYRKILEFDPGHVEANYQMARLLEERKEFAASLKHLERLPPEAREKAPALALDCADEAALGRRARAEAAANQLTRAEDLTESDVLPVLAALNEHHAGDLAERLLEALDRRALASAAGLQALAGLEEKQGRFKEARRALEKDLQLEPPSAAVLTRLAKLAYESADFEGALGYLAHARDLAPTNAAIHFFFGMVCIELKLPPEAKQSLMEAVRLDPGNADYHYALGAVLLGQRNADEAILHFREYRAQRPADPHGNFALGVAYFDASQTADARRELERAAARPQTQVGANLYLGRLALREDNLTEAAERLEKAVRSNPSSPEPYAELALVCIRRGEFAPAEKNLAWALKIAPDHFRTNLNLLMLYQRTKDPRAEQQALRVAELQKAGEERERLLLRSLEIRPY